MNIKINKTQFEYLKPLIQQQFVIGSRMYGTEKEDSDSDYLCIYLPPIEWGQHVDSFPNVHQFQYDGDNEQYIFTTLNQFWRNQRSGDSTINTDVLLFTDFLNGEMKLNYCRTYKVIKAYLGFAKRDLKDSRKKNKLFHALRSIYVARELMNYSLPKLDKIQRIGNEIGFEKDLQSVVKSMREELNDMYQRGDIQSYYTPPTNSELLNLLLDSNNTKEFRYI